MEAQAPSKGIDIESQIRSGVEAFIQSQDPAIAIEVVNMLAESMGIAPEIDPFSGGQGAQAQSPTGQAPQAKKGMKVYRIGGKLMNF